MANSAQRKAANHAASYRAEMIAEITAALPTCTSLVLIMLLAVIRKFRRQHKFETEQELCLAAGAQAKKGLPRQTRLPLEGNMGLHGTGFFERLANQHPEICRAEDDEVNRQQVTEQPQDKSEEGASHGHGEAVS